MKRTTKKLVSMLLAVLMLVTVAMPVTASAAVNYVIKNLNAGTWVGQSYKYNGQTGIHYTYYKITVDKAGELDFSYKGDEYGGITIYNSKSDLVNSGTKYSRTYLSANTKNKNIAVEKGTYYLNVSSGSWKYTFKAAVNKDNYRMGKALALKAGATVRICQSPKMNYGRWYKVTLTSKKKLYYATNYGTGNVGSYDSNAYLIEIYNASGKRIETVKNGSEIKYCTKAKLAKGTYYIYVKSNPVYAGDRAYAFGNVVTLKWK